MKNEVKGNTFAKSNKQQTKRNDTGLNHNAVNSDSTQQDLVKGNPFSVTTAKMHEDHKIDRIYPVSGGKNSHTANRGLDTLASDSRNDPLAGTDLSYGMLDANAKNNVRITEAGDRGGKKVNPKGNVCAG